MGFKARTNIKHNGKRYAPGESIEDLTRAQADDLLAVGALEYVETEQPHDDEPAKSGAESAAATASAATATPTDDDPGADAAASGESVAASEPNTSEANDTASETESNSDGEAVTEGNDPAADSAAAGEPNLASSERLNINTATAEELAEVLKGVGPKTAEDIVAHRKQKGNFSDVNDLANVGGIRKQTVLQNKARITV